MHDKEVVKDLFEITYDYIGKDRWSSVVRSIIASLTLYNINTDYFLYTYILYEIPSYGGLINPTIQVLNFLPNIYIHSQTIQVFDIIRFIISILL